MVKFPAKGRAEEKEMEKFVVDYTGFIYYIIKKEIFGFVIERVGVKDLFSYGMIGLLKAKDNFNPNLGSEFKSFAWTCIKNELYRGIACMSYTKIGSRCAETKQYKEHSFVSPVKKSVLGVDDPFDIEDGMYPPTPSFESEIINRLSGKKVREIIEHSLPKMPRREQKLIKNYLLAKNSSKYNGSLASIKSELKNNICPKLRRIINNEATQ